VYTLIPTASTTWPGTNSSGAKLDSADKKLYPSTVISLGEIPAHEPPSITLSKIAAFDAAAQNSITLDEITDYDNVELKDI
jgi:hypothetical protein